jgi:hypothetical protein
VNVKMDEYENHKNTIELIDNRLEKEKETYLGSSLITSCEYGLFNWGDDMSLPDKLQILSAVLAKQLNDMQHVSPVRVNSFSTVLNMQNQLKANAKSFFGVSGVIPYLTSEIIESVSCKTDIGIKGAITEQENPYRLWIWVVNMDIDYSDENYSYRGIKVVPENGVPRKMFGDLLVKSSMHMAKLIKANNALKPTR